MTKRQDSGDRIEDREQQEQEEPVPVPSQHAAAIWAAAAIRSRTPSVTTEARVELKAKPAAKVPVMIWTIPKARNQPQFFLMPVTSCLGGSPDCFSDEIHQCISSDRNWGAPLFEKC